MTKKIAFLGLDAAGKTSIIQAITKRFGFEKDLVGLLPTKRIARDQFKFLGLNMFRMDFGGQQQYRDVYLKDPGKYLGGTDMIFYVIDAQDYERYVLSMDYLDQIILYFKEEQSYPPIAVLFHKFDPLLMEDREINKKILTLKQALTRYDKDFNLFFFETSVYDIKSIMDAFSIGLSLLFDQIEMVSHLFAELSKSYNCVMISLFDSRGITIGEFYRPHLQLKTKLKIYDIYIEVQKRIITENRTLYEFSDKFEDGARFSGIVEVLTFSNIDFYLLFIVEENETDLGKTVELMDKIEAAKPEISNLILQIIQ